MKLENDNRQERLITLTFTEAELREIEKYSEYYASATNGTGLPGSAGARLNTFLKSLALGERRDWEKLFK